MITITGNAEAASVILHEVLGIVALIRSSWFRNPLMQYDKLYPEPLS